MMNHLLAQLKAAEQRGYANGVNAGKEAEKAVMVAALNETFHFAGDRLAKVEAEEQRIWKEEIYGNLDTGARHLIQRLNQIKGVEVGSKREDI